MLVLTRKIKQQVQIGPEITITILKVKGQTIRVGIEAPRNVSVLRAELAEKPAAVGDPATLRSAAAAVRREKQRAGGTTQSTSREAETQPTSRPTETAAAPAQCPAQAGSVPLVRLGTRNRRRLLALASAAQAQS